MSGNPPPFREGTSPIDREELARLLPAGLDAFGTGAPRDGNSPPMDQEAWMQQMMSSLWMNAQQQQGMGGGGGVPGGMAHPGMPQPAAIRPGGQHQHGGYHNGGGRGGRGGNGQFTSNAFIPDANHHRGRGRGGRGGGRGGYMGDQQQQHQSYTNGNGGGYQPNGGGGRGRGGRGGNYGGGSPYGEHHSYAPSADSRGEPAMLQTSRGSFAIVEFKRERLKKYPCPADIPTGEYVIVDGDRGQDCGLLVQTMVQTATGVSEVNALDGTEVDGQKLRVESGRVLRVASELEIGMLHNEIAQLERAALKTCRHRVREMGFNFEVIDCEYQFDRKKISFFFSSDNSIDFRELVKDLYKLFGARIWMENINPSVKNTVPQGALSRHEKVALARAGGASRRDEVSVSARPFYPRARQPKADPAAAPEDANTQEVE